MICEKCGQDKKSKGRTPFVYYGKILSVDTKNYNTLISTSTVTKTYYKHIHKEAVHMCSECLSAYRKRKLLTLPLKWLIPLSPYIIMSIASKTFGAFYIIGGIMLLVMIYVAVSLKMKKYEKKPYKFDLYPWAKKVVKQRLKKANPKATYTFWKEYPKNIKEVRY